MYIYVSVYLSIYLYINIYIVWNNICRINKSFRYVTIITNDVSDHYFFLTFLLCFFFSVKQTLNGS